MGDRVNTRFRSDPRAIVEAIDRRKFEVVPIAITKEGKWLAPASRLNFYLPQFNSLLPSKTHTVTGDVAFLGDPSHKGLIFSHNNEQRYRAKSSTLCFRLCTARLVKTALFKVYLRWPMCRMSVAAFLLRRAAWIR